MWRTRRRAEHYVYAWWWELFEFSRKWAPAAGRPPQPTRAAADASADWFPRARSPARRLMFSCVVGFISRGSAQQVVVATTLSFFTFLFFREVAPFASRNLYIVGYVSNFTLFAFLYIALLLKMSVALGAGGNNSIGFTLLVGALTFGIFIVPAGVIIRSLFNYKLELAQPVPPKSAAPKKGKAGAPPKDAQDATGAAEKAATAGAAHEARHSTGAPHAAHHAAPSHAAAHHAAEKHAASEHPSH